MLPTIAPPMLSSSLAPPPPLDVAEALPPPATRLDAAAARLAAAVGDAGELVAAARALQADGERARERGRGMGAASFRAEGCDTRPRAKQTTINLPLSPSGGVPAGVLRQLSTALRVIGEQQSAALAEAAALLDGAAAARTLADAAAETAGAPPPPRPLTLGERRALNQEEGTPEDEAAASAADAVAEVASVLPSGGFVSLRVAGDLSELSAVAQRAAATAE